MQTIGKKIVVVGVLAAGKTTFTRKLVEKTGLSPIFVDTIFWKPDWTYIGDEAAAKELNDLSSADQWIIEGYLPFEIKEVVFERADKIIFLDYPRLLMLLRYVSRWWKHRKIPRPELNGNTERLRWKNVKRVWNKSEAKALEIFLDRSEFKNKVVKLKSPNEADIFLKTLFQK